MPTEVNLARGKLIISKAKTLRGVSKSMGVGQEYSNLSIASNSDSKKGIALSITTQNQSLKKRARIDCAGLMEQVEVLQEIARQNQERITRLGKGESRRERFA